MRVAVVGANGQLGAALVHEWAAAHEVTAFTRTALDVSDERAVAAAMARTRPETILNAAAFTDVDAAEARPIDALNGNAFAVRALARAAQQHGATLVHYSSDFVFDGKTASPYTESDQPNPQSVYAASKLLGEWFANDAPRTYVLRVESLFGLAPGGGSEKGSVATILNAINTGVAVKVFEDRTVSPSYRADVVRATRRLVESAAAPGLYHCVNSGHCTWLEFARELAGQLGVEPTLVPIRLADAKLKASRPQYCALSNEKLRQAGVAMPPWQDALRRYLQSLGGQVAHEISHRQ
jgi:dTDP-4-dehydrorhamnose reductase